MYFRIQREKAREKVLDRHRKKYICRCEVNKEKKHENLHHELSYTHTHVQYSTVQYLLVLFFGRFDSNFESSQKTALVSFDRSLLSIVVLKNFMQHSTSPYRVLCMYACVIFLILFFECDKVYSHYYHLCRLSYIWSQIFSVYI
jgi:hypothetical protein